MKKISILTALVLVAIFYAATQSNYILARFMTESFYRPIGSEPFDPTSINTSAQIKISANYDVRHGFFLTFPCEMDSEFFVDLDGSMKFTFKSEGKILESKIVSFPKHPIAGYSDGVCDVAVFSFDLPFQENNDLMLEVSIISPTTKLSKYKDKIHCEVKPAYWPK